MTTKRKLRLNHVLFSEADDDFFILIVAVPFTIKLYA